MPPRKPSPPPRPRSYPPRPPALPPEVVDPIWLAKALAISFLAAVFCAWLSVCLLYYQGEWQLLLHPSHVVAGTPASLNLLFEDIHFDALETGQPRLTAWWIPAQAPTQSPAPSPTLSTPPPYAGYTILYLHGGSGSLSDTLPTLSLLHRSGINLFAVDYRSFGHSDLTAHPSEVRMSQDTAAAFDYLTQTRHLPSTRVIPYGVGLGAALAAGLARNHPEIPAVILDNPDPNPSDTAATAHRSHIVPIRLLLRDRFDIASTLPTLATPKLIILSGPNQAGPPASVPALQLLAHQAASPTLTVTLPSQNAEAPFQSTLTRFLDQYLPAATRLH